MFRSLRIRLTFWYTAVLAVALLCAGVALYLGVRQQLLAAVESDLTARADMRIHQLMGPAHRGCFPSGPGPQDLNLGRIDLVACFDKNGNLISTDFSDQMPAGFLDNTLVQDALRNGKASDIADGGSIGPIARYAVAIRFNNDDRAAVLMVGAPFGAQQNALSALLTQLLGIGGLALIGAGAGGLFLAHRALAPARLAWANQQRFIADASHELRTPLTLLRADAEVLLRNPHLDSEDAMLLENIVTETQHMSTLSNNMLALARLDHGPAHLEHDIVRLGEIARAGVLRVQALAEQMNIKIDVEINDEAVVIGDPTLLEQAMLILLDNAIKYNRPGGSVTVRTSIRAGLALLEVSDTGIGISAEHLQRLGERFYRVDKARSRKAGGTGLGLSIAHGIASAHHGHLTLTSTPDQGTTALLTLHRAGS